MAWTELPSSGSSPCTQRHPQIGPCWFAAWPDLLTLELFTRALFGSFLRLRKRPEFGTKRPVSAASTGWRSVHSGTLQGATGGTQTHSRRTGSKLGRLHRARQGLVRVPESNTKYGGKRGKTGGPRASDVTQVSVSPQGFPSEKNLFHRPVQGFVPLFTGQLFIVGEGLPRQDSREATGRSSLACLRADGLEPE
jgi:hypothetical protein